MKLILGASSMNKYTIRKLFRIMFCGRYPFGLYRKYIIDTCSNGIIMKYNSTTDVGRSLFFYGSFEQSDIGYISNLIENNGHIIDVGANIGYHSICWSAMIPNYHVHSFEPGKETFDLLEFNVEKNQKNNIILMNVAVSDKSGIATFYHCSDDAYSSLKDTKRKEIVSTYEVKVITIDDYVKSHNLENVSFIKIDVEGLEHNVLIGAKETLLSKKPIVFCEIYAGSNSNENPLRTIHFIEALGYKPFILKDGKPEVFECHDDKYYNYLFMPIERLKTYGRKRQYISQGA